MHRRQARTLLTAVLLAALGGALIAYLVIRIGARLVPADMAETERTAVLTLAGYISWAVAALAISAAWLRRSTS